MTPETDQLLLAFPLQIQPNVWEPMLGGTIDSNYPRFIGMTSLENYVLARSSFRLVRPIIHTSLVGIYFGIRQSSSQMLYFKIDELYGILYGIKVYR